MVRRSLGVALWSVAGLLACFLGALSALVGTGAGRGLVGHLAERAVTEALAGTVEVGDVSGALITGVTLTDVRLYDEDTTLVAWLPRAELSYNPFDFAAGRVVLLGLRLERPLFNLVEHPDGRLNLEVLLRLGLPASGPRRPAPLVLFRDVQIEDGSFVLRLRDRPSPDDTLHEVGGHGAQGRLRVRRFDHLAARLAALRLSSPRERGIRLDIEALAFDATDPAVRVTDARGRVVVVGDSLEAALDRLSLPGSRLAARGRVRWPRDTLLYDLDLRVDSATLTDFRFIDRRYPSGAVLRGGVTLRSRGGGGRVLEVNLDPLDVTYRGGSLQGRVRAVSAAGQGLVAVRQGDLAASELDLEFVRPFLDTLPFAGRLTGHTVADGRVETLALDVDWTFRDSLVAGWPVTRIRGRGEVDLAGPDGIHFQPFALEAATIDLGTARRLVPALTLQGTLDAAGTLTGPYRAAEFSGTLRHRDGDRPASVVRGVVQLDAREDVLGVYADVATDSLSWDGLRGSFPSLPFKGAAGGTIRLSGTQEALETHVVLAAADGGGGGLVRGDGVLTLRAPRYGARAFTLRAVDADLQRWLPRAPASRLSATLVGGVEVDSGAAAAGRIEIALAPSIFAGTVLDSGAALVRVTDGRLVLDSLWLAQPGMVTRGSGSLGLGRDSAHGALRAGNGPADGGALTLVFDADSLSSLDSLVGWAAGLRADAGTDGEEALRGTARVAVTLTGTLDSLGVAVRAEGERLHWRGWVVPKGRARLAYAPGPVPALDLDVALDSLGRDELGFGAVSARARGVSDSLTWFARSRIGDLGAFLAGGRFARREPDGVAAVGIDSLALLLPGGVWFLEGPARFALGDSIARLDGFVVRNAGGPGRLTLEGDLPVRGRANANLHLEAFPLAGLYALLQRDTVGVGGALTATFGMTGTRADPVYRGSFALSAGALGRFRIPFLDGSAEYRDRRLDGNVHLWRSGQQILGLTTHLPLDLSLAKVAERQLPDTLSVRAQADSVDLSLLEAVMPLVRDVRGDFSADVQVRGTWEAPSLDGSVRIGNAAAFIPTLNVRYEGVDGRFALSGDTVRVESLTARSDKGTARVAGVVRLERLTRPVLDLSITADQFRALDLRGYLSLTASGELSLTGPVIGAALRGRGTVTSGVLYFADLVTKRVVNLDEPWVASLIDTSLIRRQRLGPEFESVFLDSLRIRGLELAMGSDVWLRSTEANIQLTGTVAVNKERDEYRLTGTLGAPRGTYRLVVGPITREFVVTRGTVRYFGTPDLDAALDIEARHVVHPVATRAETPQDLTVIARIRGTLLVPRLSLEAEGRQLSQAEIISYLLFGQPTIELAGPQGAFASRTALSIVAGELERTLVSDLGVPLDYLEVEFRSGVDQASVSGARLAAGWQIGRKTFLVLNAGFCREQRLEPGKASLGASLQFRISPEWRTEASFEPVASCGGVPGQTPLSATRQLGLDLFWERRY